MNEEMLDEALGALEQLHAAVWAHFDPEANQGDKKQPANIKEALTKARQFARSKGKVFDGWGR